MSFPGPGHCRQTGVPIDQQLPGLVTFLLGPLLRPWRFNSSTIQSFWGPWEDIHEAPIGRTTGGIWSARVTLPMTSLVGITKGWALRFLKQIGTQEEPGCNTPYVAVGTMEVGSWGPHAGSASMWTCIQWPQTSVLPCILTISNGGMDMLLDIIQGEFLGCGRVRGCGGSYPLHSIPIPPWPLWSS